MKEIPMIEFEFQNLNDEDVHHLKERLLEIRQVEWISYDSVTHRLCIKSSIPINELQKLLIQLSKSNVEITGMGQKCDSAIVQLFNYQNETIKKKGVIRIIQLDESNCLINGYVEDMEQGNYEIVLFENGDLSNGLKNLGNDCSLIASKDNFLKISIEEKYRSEFKFLISSLRIENLFGRSIFFCRKNEKICGGIVARSSKVFDNTKNVCSCIGTNICSEKLYCYLHP